MQKQDFENALADDSMTAHDQINNVAIWDLARDFHVTRNTVANIAKDLSIDLKYENYRGTVRACVYSDEASEIRRVLDEKYNIR